MYLESKTESIFGIACVGKKLAFAIGNTDFFAYYILKSC